MPANTSFKVMCPSCEAQVPVRDSALIGKKIECPKCKYRFVVEEPADDEVRDAEAVRRPKAKKKAGSRNMVLLGSILGAVALLILGVGGYFLFFYESPKPSLPGASLPITRTPTTTDSTPTPVVDAGKPAAEPAVPVAQPGSPTGDSLVAGLPVEIPFNDISNLLPGDAQTVLALHVDRFRASKVGYIAFESRSGFKPELFQRKLGIGVEEITRFVRAENLDNNWSFNVLTVSRPVTLDELKPALGLERAPKSPIQGREFYRIAPNELLDNLAQILQSEIEARESRGGSSNPSNDSSSRRPKAGPLMLVQANPTTLIIATQDPMEEFLNAGAKWEWKSRPAPGAGDPAAAGATSTEPGGSGEAGALALNKNRREEPPPGSAGGQQFTNRPTFLSIEPALKAMMDRLEGDGQKVIGTMSQRLQANSRIVDRIREASGLRQLEVRGMNILGVALYEFDSSRFKAEAAVETFREADAKIYEEAIKAVLPGAAQALGTFLGGLKIDVEGGGGGGGGGATTGPGGAGGAGSESVGAPPPPDAVGSTGPAGGGSVNTGPSDGPKSTLSLSRRGRLLRLGADFNLTLKAYDRLFELAQNLVIRSRGMVDMASATPHWHELGRAGVATYEKDGSLPRGTFVREDSLGSRISRNFPPHNRVGWLAGLLPYLGHQDIFNGIDKKKSWRDEENMKYGAILIPEFLNPRFPRTSWRASVPSLGIRDQGATHVVGVAGIGLDAADYSLNDPTVAKKIGMIGYDRRATVKDVTDGMSNTIYMIQVPPGLPRPWIAGGGATVTGVPEKDSIRPFVAAGTGSGGKRGATVIMGDGSVRFIDEMVSDDVFKALCTIRGGEEIVDLDKQAPKVDPPKKGELRTASATGGGVPAKPQAPAGELK